MAQTKAQNTQSIRIGSVKMLLDGTDIGLLEDASVVAEYNVIDLRAHNGYLPPRKRLVSIIVTAQLWEIFLGTLENIDGHGVFSQTAAAPVVIAGEVIGNDTTSGTPLLLANKNGDGTPVTSVTLKQAGTTVTATNYVITVIGGKQYLIPKTNLTGEITADYTATPAASRDAVWSDVTKLLSLHELQLVNTDENGKDFTITIPQGYSSGNMTFGFVSDDTVDDVMKMPFEFKAYPDDEGKMMQITDEQSV